jgi:ATP-dependent DNA ligase
MIVRKTGGFVRLFTGNGTDYTERLPAIAASEVRLKGESFTLDGEAVVVGRTAYRSSRRYASVTPPIRPCCSRSTCSNLGGLG